ncbi:hypothetical protein DV515_00015385 [Chloebia gouldiae]|uniref:Uncharacterized protein n=1 Tax=Chloebia gouldiae TaxID=44316 RepID=A0A3L8RVB9_CHLGU|nr:hypothetical protein DV515_00015385 [Chloebia gouldiae]
MFASSPPAGWGGCGELHDGNPNAEQMYRVSLGEARIWPRCAGTGAPPAQRSRARGASRRILCRWMRTAASQGCGFR